LEELVNLTIAAFKNGEINLHEALITLELFDIKEETARNLLNN
jgi:hypothetical protein